MRFIRIKCEGCDHLLRVSAEHAGKRVRCPAEGCRGVSRLPNLNEIQALGLSDAPGALSPELTEAPASIGAFTDQTSV